MYAFCFIIIVNVIKLLASSPTKFLHQENAMQNVLWFMLFFCNLVFLRSPSFVVTLWLPRHMYFQEICVSLITIVYRYHYYSEIILLHVSIHVNNGDVYCRSPVEMRPTEMLSRPPLYDSVIKLFYLNNQDIIN